MGILLAKNTSRYGSELTRNLSVRKSYCQSDPQSKRLETERLKYSVSSVIGNLGSISSCRNLPVEITVVTRLNVKKVENLPVSKTITYRL